MNLLAEFAQQELPYPQGCWLVDCTTQLLMAACFMHWPSGADMLRKPLTEHASGRSGRRAKASASSVPFSVLCFRILELDMHIRL